MGHHLLANRNSVLRKALEKSWTSPTSAASPARPKASATSRQNWTWLGDHRWDNPFKIWKRTYWYVSIPDNQKVLAVPSLSVHGSMASWSYSPFWFNVFHGFLPRDPGLGIYSLTKKFLNILRFLYCSKSKHFVTCVLVKILFIFMFIGTIQYILFHWSGHKFGCSNFVYRNTYKQMFDPS